MELDFEQYPISKFVDGQKEHVIRTTFYSTSTGYEFSFDTPILTENLQYNNENGSKVANTVHQLIGSAIIYVKSYALVACLHIKSEVDTDAALIYNNYENRNSMPSKQVGVSQKQEINQIQKTSFIKNIDPNNVDDIKKIEADLISYFEKNSDFKSINYWAEIIKDYFKENNLWIKGFTRF